MKMKTITTNSQIEIYKKLEEINQNNDFKNYITKRVSKNHSENIEFIVDKEIIKENFYHVYFLLLESRISIKKLNFDEDQNIFISDQNILDLLLFNHDSSIFIDIFKKYLESQNFIELTISNLKIILGLKNIKLKKWLREIVYYNTTILVNLDWLLNEISPEIYHNSVKPNANLIDKELFTKISSKIRKEKINSIF